MRKLTMLVAATTILAFSTHTGASVGMVIAGIASAREACRVSNRQGHAHTMWRQVAYLLCEECR
jgi:hypothetical protein